MFIFGGLISATGYNTGVFNTSVIFPYFILFITLKLFYDFFLNKERKADKLKVSYLIIIVAGLDCFAGGMVIEQNRYLATILMIILSFSFTISGFYGSRLFTFAKQTFVEKLS